MSISLRLRPTTLLVAGALLAPSAAFAQVSVLPIVPAEGVSAPVPSAVASPATVSVQPKIDSMSFNNVDVADLLDMISTQFNIPIAIAGDVSGRIRTINLREISAEQAIDTVTRVAGLSCQKADGIYIFSKAAPVAAVAPLLDPQIVPVLPPLSQGFGGNRAANIGNPSVGSFNSPGSDVDIRATRIDNDPVLDNVGNGTDSKKRNYPIRVRNIKPSLMAYWLDPANHEMPIEIQTAKNSESRYGHRPFVTDSFGGQTQTASSITNQQGQNFNAQGLVPNNVNPWINSSAESVRTLADAQFGNNNNNNNNNGGGGGRGNQNGGGRGGQNGGRGGNGGVFQLPTGVDRIVAVDPQNTLLVFGNPQGFAELSRTIAFLDRPLRQVEIEAQFLSINTSDANTYGFDFSTSRGNFNASSTGTATSTTSGGLQFGFIRGNFQAAIAAATNSGRAKLLTAPRVTAINNLTANLEQTTSTPIILTTTNTIANNAISQNTSQQVFYVTTTIGLEVTPTINNDDTVTVLMRPVLQSQGTPNSLGASQITSQALETIANVRDGETIALGGLRSKNISLNKTKVPLLGDIPFFGQLFTSRSTSEIENELIIFLTARIIRRAGDDDSIAGTDLAIGTGG